MIQIPIPQAVMMLVSIITLLVWAYKAGQSRAYWKVYLRVFQPWLVKQIGKPSPKSYEEAKIGSAQMDAVQEIWDSFKVIWR